MDYRERIKNLREDNDYTQEYIARELHVAQTTYSDYEHGYVKIPIDCLIRLARFYNVDMNYITGVSNIKRKFPDK